MKPIAAAKGKNAVGSVSSRKRSGIPAKSTDGPVKLNTDVVKGALAPTIGSITLWDSEITGFGIRIFAATERHPEGARSFFVNYRVNGRERRYTIGAFPAWSVVAAREEARELRQRVDRGEDPASDKRARREAPTVQDLIERYLTEHLHLPIKPPGEGAVREHPRLTDQRRMLAEIAAHLGKDRKVADVHFGDMQAMHRRITESGRPVRANRILGIASKAFSLSLRPMAGEDKAWRDAAAGNPCKGVPRNREEGRERFFSQTELAAISDALAAYPAQTPADCIRLIMLTGCRPAEALRATWQEFDQEPGFWSKPSAHTKQKKRHVVPLAPAALELIERRRQERDKATRKGRKPSEWVFPGAVPGEPIAALWHIWHHVRDHAGLGKDAYVYTLRHSFASIGAGGGLSLPIIGRLLGHTQQRTTQRYAHLADDPLKEAASRIGSVIAGAASKKPGAAVVPIKGGRAS
jgi:integrase